MLIRDFETFRVRCRICKVVKEREDFKRMSYRICTQCKDAYYKRMAKSVMAS